MLNVVTQEIPYKDLLTDETSRGHTARTEWLDHVSERESETTSSRFGGRGS
jgi:hypothetical protein